ncbi:MAG: O-antigen ligase family protein [Fuerstiella sp.]
MSSLAKSESKLQFPSETACFTEGVNSLLRAASRSSAVLQMGLILLCGAVFLTEGHRWDRSGLKDYSESAVERADAASRGNNLRRIAYLALGGTGVLLVLSSGKMPAIREPMGVFLFLAIAWTYSSVIWADTFSFTLKRLLLLSLCAAGTVGLASCLSLKNLTVTVFGVTTAYLGIGIVAEIMQGNFRPWASGYRFAGTLHPNAQASNCGAMVFSALALTRRSVEEIGMNFRKRKQIFRFITGSLFVLGLFCLLLTKSRTAIAGVLLIVGLTWASRKSIGTNFIVGGMGLLLLFSLTYTVVVTGAGRDVGQTANLGRDDSQGAFNGRLPIWEICLRQLGRKSLIGCGYDGFWTGARIEDVSWELGWDISSAHSEFIEVVLGVGIIGLVLYAGVQFCGIGRFWYRYRNLGYGGDGLMMGMLLIGLIQGFMETGFLHPYSFGPFVTLCGIVRLAFFTDQITLRSGAV